MTCIYYPHRDDLSFEKREHVLPAGIGGIKLLPRGFVSDQFNQDMSKIELRFMRNSIIAMPRQLLGPGKRGKTGIKHATRSEVLLIENNEKPGLFSLGYLQLGKAIHLPQIRIDTDTGQIIWSVDTTQPQPDQFFLAQLRSYNPTNIRFIPAKQLPQQEVLIGFGEHFYIARPQRSNFTLTPELIQGLIASIQSHSDPVEARNEQITIRQIAHIDDDFYRVCAKIAFNTLAWLEGQEFVLRPMFDPIRHFITQGGPNHFATYSKTSGKLPQLHAYAHRVLIGKSNGKLCALVCLYNHFAVTIILAQDFTATFETDGLICDWQNKKEYRLNEKSMA